jgi:hypothetical protein
MTRYSSMCSALMVAVLVATVATAHAQSSADFSGEPDKTMASAHDAFVKRDVNKAAAHIQKAAAYVRTESGKVAKDAKESVMKAGAGVEGAAKWSGTQLKEGTQASIDGLKKAGKGAKLGAEDVGKFFKGLGDGIADLGQKLSS